MNTPTYTIVPLENKFAIRWNSSEPTVIGGFDTSEAAEEAAKNTRPPTVSEVDSEADKDANAVYSF